MDTYKKGIVQLIAAIFFTLLTIAAIIVACLLLSDNPKILIIAISGVAVPLIAVAVMFYSFARSNIILGGEERNWAKRMHLDEK